MCSAYLAGMETSSIRDTQAHAQACMVPRLLSAQSKTPAITDQATMLLAATARDLTKTRFSFCLIVHEQRSTKLPVTVFDRLKPLSRSPRLAWTTSDIADIFGITIREGTDSTRSQDLLPFYSL
jgi:hypothetical protein